MPRGAPPSPDTPNDGRIVKHEAFSRKQGRENRGWTVQARISAAGSVAMVLLLVEYTVRWFV